MSVNNLSHLFALLRRRLPLIFQGQLASNAAALYAVQVLNYLMPLLLLPFLLRSLQPHGYGAIMLAQSVIGYALIVVEFGFNFSAARAVSIARLDVQEVARIFWTITFAKMLLLGMTALVIGVVVILVPAFNKDWPLVAVSGLILVGNIAFPQWYFQGLERLKEVALFQAVAKVVVTLSAIVLVRTPEDMLLAATILASPQIVGAIVSWCCGKQMMPNNFYKPTLHEILGELQRSKHLFIANIATTLYLHTNSLVLGILVGEVAVAMYSVASRVVLTIQGLAAPAFQAVFPRASQLFATSHDDAWRMCEQLAKVMFPSMLFASITLLVFAHPLISLLAGPQYHDAIPLLRILAFVPFLVTVAMLLSQIIMVNIDLAKQLSRIYLSVGLINLAILWPLVHYFGDKGAACSLLFAEALGPILMIIAIKLRVLKGASSWA